MASGRTRLIAATTLSGVECRRKGRTASSARTSRAATSRIAGRCRRRGARRTCRTAATPRSASACVSGSVSPTCSVLMTGMPSVADVVVALAAVQLHEVEADDVADLADVIGRGVAERRRRSSAGSRALAQPRRDLAPPSPARCSRGDDGTKMKPRKSAPSSAQNSASSSLVMPQILILVMIRSPVAARPRRGRSAAAAIRRRGRRGSRRRAGDRRPRAS